MDGDLESEFETHIVDAPRNAEARAAQEAKWAGDYDGRQHWSLREAYLIHRNRLRAAQGDLYRLKLLLDAHFSSKSSPLRDLDLRILERVADFCFAQGQAVAFLAGWRKPLPDPNPQISFVARKRPLLKFEVAAGEWDCVSVSRLFARVVCHDGRLHRTGRRLEMTHKKFILDRVYGSDVSDEEFYNQAVRPLVRSLNGNQATIIFYGQTGTGKTHTFNACWERIGNDLAGHSISVTFFEVLGKKCFDLLQQRKEVTLRSDSEERVHVRGAATLTAAASELPQLLEEALNLRRSEATERNPLSSRSHAICVLEIGDLGSIRFVDLAGSERNYETRHMTAQQHRDFAEINKSLMALKDCFRAHAKLARQRSARPPYRASRLTQVLRSCFTDSHHRTLILSTLSPTATDLLHSTNSLAQVTQMSAALSALRSECSVDLPLIEFAAAVPIWDWSEADVHRWINTADNGRFKYLVLPPQITGAALLKLSSKGLAELFDMSLRQARGRGEGQAWNEAAAREVGLRIGRMFFAAVRREALRWPDGQSRLMEAERLEATERGLLEEGLNLPPEAERHCEFFFWGDAHLPVLQPVAEAAG
ncbi:DSK1 [Symbiodinium pilosum]|uniref:Kinesin-like protein n=1 Tax=Symbiodinium pilosum TaxID=2952 RepID=A0A812IMP7_SYMPI|nr:DSK1 [Symbiodinium pilosum]